MVLRRILKGVISRKAIKESLKTSNSSLPNQKPDESFLKNDNVLDKTWLIITGIGLAVLFPITYMMKQDRKESLDEQFRQPIQEPVKDTENQIELPIHTKHVFKLKDTPNLE